MTTEELKHYYSIFFFNDFLEGDNNWELFKDFQFVNKFFTREEAANCIIANENNRFVNKILTILEIFQQ